MTDNALPAGHRIQAYTVEQVLGAGNFGITYLAQHDDLKIPVAIKEYCPVLWAMRTHSGVHIQANTIGRSLHEDEPNSHFDWGMSRFLEEARLLSQIQHDGVARVRDYFQAQGSSYLVMDYEAGETLEQTLKRQQVLEYPQVWQLARQILEALAAVHQKSILHRDLKPANVYLRARDQRAMLIDFGAARIAIDQHSRLITSIMTPGYAPIEQYDSDSQRHGPATDIYALGAILHQCIGTERLVTAPNRLSHDTLKPAVIVGADRYPEAFLKAIDRALAVKSQQRFASAQAFSQAIERMAQPEQLREGMTQKIVTPPPPAPRRDWRIPIYLLMVILWPISDSLIRSIDPEPGQSTEVISSELQPLHLKRSADADANKLGKVHQPQPIDTQVTSAELTPKVKTQLRIKPSQEGHRSPETVANTCDYVDVQCQIEQSAQSIDRYVKPH